MNPCGTNDWVFPKGLKTVQKAQKYISKIFKKQTVLLALPNLLPSIMPKPGISASSYPFIPPVFKTPLPDGPFRHEIVVEVLSMDGRNFTGTITPTEARKVIIYFVNMIRPK